MNIVYFLIPMALLISGFFMAAFFWAVKHGEFDDLETPRHRVLIDDEELDFKSLREEEANFSHGL